jgi:Secretion system C-terminal sorting domain
MKRISLAVFSLAWLTNLSAQVIYSEDFTGLTDNSLPALWQVSSNTDVHTYQRPFADCITDKGLQTPAVGQNAPSRLILPPLNFDAAHGIISISFDVFVMNSNLECNRAKSFPCPTFVTVFLIKSNYSNGTSHLPEAADIYAQQSYHIQNANAGNAVIFENPSIPDGSNYEIYFDFKTAENSACSASGTKFVFDDFVVSKSYCGDHCAPVANNDYFDGNRQGFVNEFKANVYGGFLLWSSQVKEGYELASLSMAPAVNNGLDYDANNHPLSEMKFELVSEPIILNSQGCPLGSSAGILNWSEDNDGTFQFIRTSVCVNRVSFQYKIVDPTLLESNLATVTIDFAINSPLPANFYSFTGQREKTIVTLKWQTASEKSCKGFYVQRNTGDGWVNAGFVFSSTDGASNPILNYEFHEANTSTGVTLYRLAEQDFDDFLRYSDIVVVTGTEQSDRIVVYPNPSTTGSVNAVFQQGSVYRIELFDAAGRKIREWRKASGNVFTINNLRTGVYLLKAQNLTSKQYFNERFIVTGNLN